MKRRLSIRVTLLLIALIAGVLGAIRWWNDPATRYRRDHDEDSFRAVLSRRVENGDPIEKIEAILGPGAPSKNPRVPRAAAVFAQRSPADYPQGVREGDEFRAYATGPVTSLFLQFRGGRLVNFDRRTYEGPTVPFAGGLK